MDRIPQPVPDTSNPMHYLPLEKTPLTTNGQTPREPDDWQPRANIIKQFKAGELSLETPKKIEEFSEKYHVVPQYTERYLLHMQNLKQLQHIRTQNRSFQRTEKKIKQYQDYDWLDIVVNGKLRTLLISELDKYLEHNKLSKQA
jgi:hypothetical protein